ncbi:MAG: SgcJ/EcaC family oxidoreductase [Isosphaeraceae bacterium]
MRPVSLWFGVVALAICQGSGAQELARAGKGLQATATTASTAHVATQTTVPAEDARSIAALAAAYAKAFNSGDAAAAAGTFTEDALIVDEMGHRTEGRERIQESLAAAFAHNPGNRMAIETKALRLLGPDTALEEGRTTITPAGGGTPETTHYTVVHVKRGGRWLQSAVHDELARDLTPHERLLELEWMVGDWINESQDSVVLTTCKWADGGNFLVREFTVKMQGQPVLSGTQRIGWDPTRNQFKTWIFDTAGGFGDGYWTQMGDRWVIKAEGIRQDGQHASVTNIITRLGKDRAHWKSVDRTIGGAAVPGFDEFTIVRKPPEAGK